MIAMCLVRNATSIGILLWDSNHHSSNARYGDDIEKLLLLLAEVRPATQETCKVTNSADASVLIRVSSLYGLCVCWYAGTVWIDRCDMANELGAGAGCHARPVAPISWSAPRAGSFAMMANLTRACARAGGE